MTSLPAPVITELADILVELMLEDEAGLYHGPEGEALHGAVERAGEREAVREAAG